MFTYPTVGAPNPLLPLFVFVILVYAILIILGFIHAIRKEKEKKKEENDRG